MNLPKDDDAVLGGTGLKPGSVSLGGVKSIEKIINHLKDAKADEILDLVNLHPIVRQKIFDFADKVTVSELAFWSDKLNHLVKAKREKLKVSKGTIDVVQIYVERFRCITIEKNAIQCLFPYSKKDFVDLLVAVNFISIALGYCQSEAKLRESMQLCVDTRSVDCDMFKLENELVGRITHHQRQHTKTMIENWYEQWDYICEFLIHLLSEYNWTELEDKHGS